jgi:hypothetical protein
MSSLRVRRIFHACCGLFTLAAVSCISPEMKLVAKATAYQGYAQELYENRLKLKPAGSPEREACKATVNDGVWQVKIANTNQKLRVLTPDQKAGLEELIVALERDCK